MRLQKYLAQCGVASRRKAEELITAGAVRVNGEPATLGQRVDPAIDDVTVSGRAVAIERHEYILLNKPAGVISSVSDTHGRPTVLDCLPDDLPRVYPVGRLDLDTQGVLLLTNDGELAERLLHPRFGARKVYLAEVVGRVTPAKARWLAAGVELDDGRTAPADVEVLRAGPHKSRLKLTLREGRKREVKRMCLAIGHRVIKLKRIAFAGLNADGLEPGAWRRLKPGEVEALRALTQRDSA